MVADTDAQPVFDHGGALEAWVCIQADVTAQVGARAAARATETRFAKLLDSAPEAIIGVADGGTIRFANAQVPKLFGYTAAELEGAPIELLIPQSFHASHVAARNQFLEQPRRRPMSNDMALFARRKDGSELPVEISLSHIEMADGNVVLCIVRTFAAKSSPRNAPTHSPACSRKSGNDSAPSSRALER